MDGQVYEGRATGPRAGRVRRHEFPGRTMRINPSFTVAEHAEVIGAVRRAGLTPTGFCAMAALAAARGETATVAADRAQYEAPR